MRGQGACLYILQKMIQSSDLSEFKKKRLPLWFLSLLPEKVGDLEFMQMCVKLWTLAAMMIGFPTSQYPPPFYIFQSQCSKKNKIN